MTMGLSQIRGLLAVASLALTVGLLAAACGGAASSGEETKSRDQGPRVGINVGDRAPSFAVVGVDGESVTLEGVLAQRRPLLLYFFTTW